MEGTLKRARIDPDPPFRIRLLMRALRPGGLRHWDREIPRMRARQRQLHRDDAAVNCHSTGRGWYEIFAHRDNGTMPMRSCGPSHCSRWSSIAIRLPFDSGVSERNCLTNVTCLGLRGLAAAPAAVLAAASRRVRSRLRARVPVSSSQCLRFS
eukprot:2816012-Karenia_brevis.AAC.2